MKILSWNSRGLGNQRGVCILHELVQREDPNLVFIMETKSVACSMECLKFSLGFSGVLTVDCAGRSGGLVLFWKGDMDLTLLSYSKHHFDAWVMEWDTGSKSRITAVYGHPDVSQRTQCGI